LLLPVDVFPERQRRCHKNQCQQRYRTHCQGQLGADASVAKISLDSGKSKHEYGLGYRAIYLLPVLLECFGWHGFGEKVSLQGIASRGLQEFILLAGFNAFGHRF
jgi:hypothetical protein